ncbi:MAG: TonB-dependent receptor [Chitinophagales bacterium]
MNALKFYIIVSLLGIFQISIAQNHSEMIYGTITDAESGETLYGASILIIGSDPLIGSSTDFDGKYKLEKVPVGRHDIKVDYLGYETAFFSQVMLTSGKSVNLDVKMTQAFENLKEIEIVAEKGGKSISEVNNEMATVSARTFSLEQSSRYAGSLSDPSRLVLSFPGVRNQGDVQNGISVRGNAPTGLLWAIEGYEVANPNHYARDNSQGAVNMISSNMLKNADFYTGAFPAQYGNATSGVFDLYLRKGNSEKHEFGLSAGFLGLEASVEGPFSKKKSSSFLIAYRYSTLALFNAVGYSLTGDDNPRFQDINYKFHFPTKKAGTFQIFGLFGASKITPTSSDEYFDYVDEYNLNVTGLKHTIRISENSLLKSAIITSSSFANFEEHIRTDKYNQNTDKYKGYRKYEQFLPIKETRLQFDTRVSSKFSAQHSMQIGFNVTAPFYSLKNKSQVQFHKYDKHDSIHIAQEIGQYEVESKAKTIILHAFMQHKYRVTENLSFTGGVHFQFYQYTKALSAEPRIGMEYNYGRGHALTFGAGLHSRLESLGYYAVENTRYIYDNVFPYTTPPVEEQYQPNKRLEPTRAIHLVLGQKYQLAPKLNLSIEAYYQHLYSVPVDTFSTSYHSAINYEYLYYSSANFNEGKGRNIGVDISLEKVLTRNYYFLVNGSIYSSKYMAYDQKWRHTRFDGNFIFSLTAGKNFVVGKNKNNRISLNMKLLWSGNNRDENYYDDEVKIDEWGLPYLEHLPFEKRFKNYFRLDTRVAYIRNKPKYAWTLSLDIQNATNRINESALQNINSQGLLPFLTYKVDF